MNNVYLCALCDGRGPLLRLRPSKWYACRSCVKQYGSTDQVLYEVVEMLKRMVVRNDQRLNNPQVLSQIQSLSKDLQARLRGTA